MDVVLGAEWLIQLGCYTTNLEEQFMEFNWQGRHYKLNGANTSSSKVQVLVKNSPVNERMPFHRNNVQLEKTLLVVL